MENGLAVKRSEGTCCISLDFKDWKCILDLYTQIYYIVDEEYKFLILLFVVTRIFIEIVHIAAEFLCSVFLNYSGSYSHKEYTVNIFSLYL